MLKRAASPAQALLSKRGHPLLHKHLQDNHLSDEIMLFIFSYLSWVDLCNIQSINQNWYRLSLDNQLWKSLYITEFGRSRLRGARGFIARADGREIKPLPGRIISEGIKDWKPMFRISSNWRTGRCSLEQIGTYVSSPSSSLHLLTETHLLLAGSIVVSASSLPNSQPSVFLSSLNTPAHALPCPSIRPSTTLRITALASDQSPPHAGRHGRLAAFTSTGEFVVFTIDHQNPSTSSRLLTHAPPSRSARTSPIVQAVYHHPLLVTLSQSFHLSLYDLSADTVTLVQSLSSFTSYPPSSLVLSTPSPSAYKLILAYAIPVFPAHWSVGATELIISQSGSDHMSVTNTRTARAIDIPQGWLDERKMRAVHEQWGRKVVHVAATQTDGKWVVLAPGQSAPAHEDEGVYARGPSGSASPSSSSPSGSSTPSSSYVSSSMYSASGLQLYRLYLPSSAFSSSVPKLTFVRTLHGQIGPVSTLALADGRCVSLGVNGSIWVWDLEAGTGTEVSSGICEVAEDTDAEQDQDGEASRSDAWGVVKARTARGARDSVAFDDRRIVTSSGMGIEVRRFDI